MKRGTEEDDGVELPDSETMKDLGQDDYKYLRVLEANKKKKEYISRKRL